MVAVSDSKGGIYKKSGLNAKEVYDFKAKTGTVVGFPGAENIAHDDLLGLDVDAIIPAALENAINASNAGRIKASIVVELANGPTTPEADDILYANNVHVIPDFLCNAGGVTVSYFEMVQNFSMYYWDEKEVQSRLDAKITSAYHEVLGTSLEFKTHMRQAAYIVAVKRVETAMRLRGWV
jgi:glutamate dehydrogenase (NAD(P)+)